MSAARADLGPVLPPRAAVHAQAIELQALAARAAEFSGTGPTADLRLAITQLDRMRAILGTLRTTTGEGAGPCLDQLHRG